MLKVILILCVALVAVNAYDFSDTYFNQFLFEEYEMLNSNTLSRQRRDADEVSAPEAVEEALAALLEESPVEDIAAVEHMDAPATEEEHDSMKTVDEKDAEHMEISAPVETPAHIKMHASPKAPAHVHVETPAPVKTHTPEPADKSSQCGGTVNEMKKDITCCDANKHDPAYFAMIRGTKKECAKKLRTNNPDVENFDPFNCQHMEKIKDLIICESECVAKTLNMLDEHGGIKREAIIDNFKKRLPEIEESKIKTLESYVDKCLEKIKDLNMKSDSKCSPAPMEFQHCMFGEMVVGCPAEHQINTTRCQKIRERYTKGISLALGKHSLYDFLHPAKRNGLQGKQ